MRKVPVPFSVLRRFIRRHRYAWSVNDCVPASLSPLLSHAMHCIMNCKVSTTFFAAILSSWLGAVAGAAPLQPNIVVMLVDDMGIMDTSVPFLTDEAGRPRRYPLNDFYRTPNMDRLASRGIRFNNFYSMSVCSPTRVSLQTGQNAARHRTTNWINPSRDNAGPQGPPEWNWRGLKPGDVTLASLLRAQGYRTIHVGKGHFSPRAFPGSDPSNLGFEVNVGGASIGAPGSYYGEKNYGNRGTTGGEPSGGALGHRYSCHRFWVVTRLKQRVKANLPGRRSTAFPGNLSCRGRTRFRRSRSPTHGLPSRDGQGLKWRELAHKSPEGRDTQHGRMS